MCGHKYVFRLLAKSSAFFALIVFSRCSWAQQPKDRLLAAASQSQLDSPGLKPWHLKLDLTLFDLAGKNPQAATVEVWWANGDMKEVESLGAAEVTNLNVGGKLFREGSDDHSFLRLDSLVQQVLDPIPEQVLDPATTATQTSQKIGGLQLDCLALQFAPPTPADIIVSPPISYCMNPGTDSLRVTNAPVGIMLARARTGTFQSKQVPIDFQLIVNGTLRDEVKISQLSTYEPAADDFKSTSNMQPVAGVIDAKGGDLLGLQLLNGNPVYPRQANGRYVSTLVNFDVVIDPDGHIASLVPVGSPNLMLQTAGANSLKQWLHRPFRICGVPVSIKTRISIILNNPS